MMKEFLCFVLYVVTYIWAKHELQCHEGQVSKEICGPRR